MADWFKFFENDLDETRLQFAIAKLPEVTSVWVGILSECCRHKSDTIRWGSNEIELFGFSRRLNITIGKTNEAVNILVEIDYIERGENTIKVLKWNKKQSDYCSRISRVSPNSVRTVSEQCPPRGEERRGEENRVEENKKKVASLPRFQKPSLEAIKLQAAKIGLSDLEAEKFFNYYESNGWRVGRNPMRSWTHALTNWKNHNYENNGRTNQNSSGKAGGITPVRGSTPVGGF